jgi:hypothetical protein
MNVGIAGIMLRIPPIFERRCVKLLKGGALKGFDHDIEQRAIHETWDLKLRRVALQTTLFLCSQFDLDGGHFPSVWSGW